MGKITKVTVTYSHGDGADRVGSTRRHPHPHERLLFTFRHANEQYFFQEGQEGV